jgi:arylsulfatase
MTVAPNVLYIVWDDVGIATWNAFGGLIETPNLNSLARRGLRFSQWHTPALPSPTRCCLLTGREYHEGSLGWSTAGPRGWQEQSVVIPPDSATLAEIMHGYGYRTYCVGKWHLSPWHAGTITSSRGTWPLARGFDRYYGFLGSQTSSWCPDLVYDNQHIDPPYPPEDGYHLNGDLADMAIEFIRDGSRTAPGKPWLCYLSFGPGSIPQLAPTGWSDACRGRFDMGYDRYREVVLASMKQLGVVPEHTGLAPGGRRSARGRAADGRLARPWPALTEEQRLLSRQYAESSAAQCCYTDHQIGRLVGYLRESGQLDDTIVVVCSANAKTPVASRGWPPEVSDPWAGAGHYLSGWAWAFRTPYNMPRQSALGGSAPSPLIISWAREMTDVAGGVRYQYHHAVDIVPTILDCAGLGPPRPVRRSPMHGVSMRYTFTAPGAPSTRRTQLYEMPGAHAIYRDGWKAVAGRRVTTGGGHDVAGAWEVYHVRADRAETRDVAARYPDQAAELAALWKTTAGRDARRPADSRLRSAARRPGSGLAGGPGRLAAVTARVPVPDAARGPAASGGRPGPAGG